MEPLFDYQQKMLNALDRLSSAGVVLKMGQGKTRVILTHLQRHPELRPTLVIAPKLVAQTTWPDETAKWVNFNVAQLTGLSAAARTKMLSESYPPNVDMYIANRDITCLHS